jgi:malate dehydrogenase
MCTKLVDEITVCDTKMGLAAAFAEDLKHVAASLRYDIEINSCEKDEAVQGADIILVSAGEPRASGVKMSRRDLAIKNAETIKTISLEVNHGNPGAKYVVISNPVDSMAMICKKYTKANFVISTGTNLESLRFRSKLARIFKVSQNKVEGWVGGEHGEAAFPLWSTTTICNQQVEKYSVSENRSFSKTEIVSYIKNVSKSIVDIVGATEYGPAASFRDIVDAIIRNTNEVFSIAIPFKFEDIPEPTFVGVPTHLGQLIGSSIYENLPSNEKEELKHAAKDIYQTYNLAVETIE